MNKISERKQEIMKLNSQIVECRNCHRKLPYSKMFKNTESNPKNLLIIRGMNEGSSEDEEYPTFPSIINYNCADEKDCAQAQETN